MPKAVDPVVIPPLSVDGGKHKFTCIGKGLLYEGHARETPESLAMLLTGPGGSAAITDRARPKAWWIAQAVFYELPHSKTSTITDIRAQLENTLRKKLLVLPPSLKSLETKSNKEFNKLNREVLEKTGMAPASKKPEEKVKASPTKKPSKTEKPSKEATLFDRVDHAKLPLKPSTANANKSSASPEKATKRGNSVQKTSAHPARSKSQSKTEGSSPKKPAKRTAETAFTPTSVSPAKKAKTATAAVPLPAKEDPWPEYGGFEFPVNIISGSHAAKPTPPAMTPGVAPAAASYRAKYDLPLPPYRAARGNFDHDMVEWKPPSPSGPPPTDPAAGRWHLRCPYIEDQWPDTGERRTLNLVRTHGNTHIEGDFCLGIVYGFLRSTKMEGRPDGEAYVTFEWVGQEEDGPVLPPRREQTGYIRFSKDQNGYPTLKGKFNGIDLCPDSVEISGSWHAAPKKNRRRWDDFDEAAYNQACAGRWGGSSDRGREDASDEEYGDVVQGAY